LKPLLHYFWFGVLLLWLGGCVTVPSHQERLRIAERLATSQNWRRLEVEAAPFVLTAYLPGPTEPGRNLSGKMLTVYIEGDGLAWLGTARVSPDPTPVDPVALHLALRQPDGQAAYLARPCQYTAMEGNPACGKKYWTSHRFAPEVIAASHQAINTLMAMTSATSLRLVGYSGGGAVAALVAAQRSDVAELLTVAGNLDPARWTSLHMLTPLSGSLNPANVASQIASLPQLHFVGRNDEVMPREIAEGFVAKQGAESCAEIVSVDNTDHRRGWVENWPDLLAYPLPCR